MTVAEVDASALPPAASTPAVAPALRIPALSPGWKASFRALLDAEPGQRQRRSHRRQPAPSLARLSSSDRHGNRSRERFGDLHPPRRWRWRTTAGSPPWPVPHASDPPRQRAAVGAPELLPLRAARRRLLPDHGQARATWDGQRLPPHPARRWRPARDCSAPWHLHPRPNRRRPCSSSAPASAHAAPRHASFAGGGSVRARDLVAARRPQQPRSLLRCRDADTPRYRSRTPAATCTTAVLLLTTSKVATSTGRPPHRLRDRRPRPAAKLRRIPLRANSVHGRDQRQPDGTRPRRLAHPH